MGWLPKNAKILTVVFALKLHTISYTWHFSNFIRFFKWIATWLNKSAFTFITFKGVCYKLIWFFKFPKKIRVFYLFFYSHCCTEMVKITRQIANKNSRAFAIISLCFRFFFTTWNYLWLCSTASANFQDDISIFIGIREW